MLGSCYSLHNHATASPPMYALPLTHASACPPYPFLLLPAGQAPNFLLLHLTHATACPPIPLLATAFRSGSQERGRLLAGAEPTGPVRFIENGAVFQADIVAGQKTGFFLGGQHGGGGVLLLRWGAWGGGAST